MRDYNLLDVVMAKQDERTYQCDTSVAARKLCLKLWKTQSYLIQGMCYSSLYYMATWKEDCPAAHAGAFASSLD